ncbi:MAG: cytochrome c3 family protein [Deferrisomatales bacterium]|nr:cytochrome c3 family protein [Deferrisomatales bacterium]
MSARRLRTLFLALPALLFLVSVPGQGRAADPFKLKPGARGNLCLDCHGEFQAKLKLSFVHTPVAEGECTGCHDPHTSKHGVLLAEEPTRVCYNCHDALVPAGALSAHRTVVEGKCGSCHDPHAAQHKNNLLQGGNELCFGCHEPIRAAVSGITHPHDPVADDCLGCHNPHASAAADSLLTSAVPGLCRECHDTSGRTFAAMHGNYPVAEAGCTSCHNPHGSNRESILYDDVHSPVARRMCSQCHPPPESPDALKARREGYDLCRGCHNDMVNVTLGKNRVHGPAVSGEGCLSCHRPHASSHPALLDGTTTQVCGKCHADTQARHERSETKHEPVQEGNCAACHDPHSSDFPFLAKQEGTIDLCGSCHDWHKHSSHPIGPEVVDPRNPNLGTDCRSCHRSHGTEYKHMIPFATITNLCVQCHEQFKR